MRWTLLAATVGLASFTAGMLVAPIDLTVPERLPAALLVDANERLFGSIRAPELREDVAPDQIPQAMRDAIIAAEDERFFEHKGVDPIAVMRAAYKDIFGGSRQGGSTITQQYVKNLYVGRERTALRKMREAVLAYRTEKKFGKEQILINYLNSVYLGNGTYGVQAASKYYFGVEVKDLDYDAASKRRSPTLQLARAAMLAGIVAAPSAYNPVRNPGRAKDRQAYVLQRMATIGKISAIEADRAFRLGLALVRQRPPAEPTEAPIFTDMVTQQLKETLAEDDLYRGGLRVKTTLDLLMQRAVDRAVYEVLPGLDPKTPDAEEPDAAVVAIDPRNGDLKAIFSSRYSRAGLNLATRKAFSTGSTIKPFVLAAALANGKELTDVLRGPTCLRIKTLRKPVCNAEPGGGTYTLRRAMAHSVNTVFIQLAQQVGTQKIKDLALAAGLDGRIDTGITMSIGGGIEVSPLSVTQGFATLAAGGVRRDVRLILEERRNADTTKTFSGIEVMKAEAIPAGRRVMPETVADQVVETLYDAVERGTGRAARQKNRRVFGKTGTTDEFTNAWFVGCAPELCIATWMGHKAGLKPMRNVHGVKRVYGGTLPARIFSTFWKTYDAIKAAEELKEAGGLPAPSVSPTRRRRTATPTPVPTPVPTSKSATPTVAPTTARPTLVPTLPTTAPPPSSTAPPTTAPP